MNEYVAALILFDEPEAFLIAEPFDFTFCHRMHPPFVKLISRIATVTERKNHPTPEGRVANLCTSKCLDPNLFCSCYDNRPWMESQG
jgi:hypothetical protein